MQLPVIEKQLDRAKKECVRLEVLSGNAVPTPAGKLPLPMSMKEAKKRGWDELDLSLIHI